VLAVEHLAMSVCIAGGSGFIGTHLCRELVDRDVDVVALSRSPESADLPAGVEAVQGDVTAGPEALAEAVAGQDAIVNLVALSPLFQPRGRTHHEVHVEGTRNLVEAAEAADVDRFVQMSALGADPDGETAYIRAKGEAEAIVRDADAQHVIYRPSVVFGDGDEFVGFTRLLTPPVIAPLPGGGKTRFQPIWVGDLAPMLADGAIESEHLGETYEVGGPEVLTLADVARLVRPSVAAVVPVPMSLARVGLALAGAIPGVPVGPDQYRSLEMDNTVSRNDVTAFGVAPDELRTLADYLGAPSRVDDPGA
jgi:NADH dehydrogenase